MTLGLGLRLTSSTNVNGCLVFISEEEIEALALSLLFLVALGLSHEDKSMLGWVGPSVWLTGSINVNGNSSKIAKHVKHKTLLMGIFTKRLWK